MRALVDADSLLYRIGFSFEDSTDWGDGSTKTTDVVAAKNAVDGVIENILFKTGCDSVELWLTGEDNFRHTIVSDYKHNRAKSTKPLCYSGLWEYMVLKYKAKVAKYSKLEATVDKKRPSVVHPYRVFLIHYLKEKGYKDGWAGFRSAWLLGHYQALKRRYMK